MKPVLFLFFIMMSTCAFAKKWDSIYIQQLLSKGELAKVIQFYQVRYSDSHVTEDAIKAAELLTKVRAYTEARQWYEKEPAAVSISRVNLLNYAAVCRLSGDYQKAGESYRLYMARYGDVDQAADMARLCDRLYNASAESASYKLEHYTFNTALDETSITFLRTNPVYILRAGKDNDAAVQYTAYQVVRIFENFAPPVKVYRKEQSDKNITGLTYTADGNTVAFSAKAKNTAGSKDAVFIAENLGGNFLNIKPFPHNSANFSLKNPAFNSDGTELYFSSDKPGGRGGFDIWKSSLENGNWTTPVNLGPLLNSMADEINPFVVQDKTDDMLYFSSNREDGFGGFDIYTATLTNTVWQDVRLQPAPVNSAGDEVSIIYDPSIKTGYFSSDRNGGKGGFDIYRFMPFNLRLNIRVSDSETREPVDYALVELRDETDKVTESVTDNSGTTVFQIGKGSTFKARVSKEAYDPLELVVNASGKLSGDSLMADVSLKRAAGDAAKTAALSSATADYIIFTGRVLDSLAKRPVLSASMRMINYTTNKLREVDLDADGRFEIKLLLNNNYKVIVEKQGNAITDEITTLGLEKNNIKICDYLLSGSALILLTDKIYKDINQLKSEKP